MSDALIVGAGMAGLACARRLQEAGWRVRLLDKGRRPGGRVASRLIDGLTFDHGAQFLSVRDPVFAAALEPAQRQGRLRPWQAPGRSAPEWVGAPSFSDLPQALAEGLELACGVEVHRLQRTPTGWTVAATTREAGEGHHHSPHLVLTAPAPQLQALLGRWAPAALSAIDYAPSWTLLLRAEAALALPLGADPHPDLAWISDETTKPDRAPGDRWTVQASAAWSRRHLEAAPAAVARALLERLAALADVPAAALQVAAVHRWRYARVTAALPGPQWMPELGLGLAGDGFAGPRIESAWLSGWTLAGQMLASA